MSLSFQKSDFTAEYREKTPKSLLARLVELDYALPKRANKSIQQILSLAKSTLPSGQKFKVLDIGCSYGINSAMLKFGESIAQWDARLDSFETEADIISSDRHRFRGDADTLSDVLVYGLDSSASAVQYACKVGLLADGFCIDLEHECPSAELGEIHVDLLLCTGCIGYITATTFSRLLSVVRAPVIFFTCLRALDSTDIQECLRRTGYDLRKAVRRGLRQRAIDLRSERASDLGRCLREYQGRMYHVADAYVATWTAAARVKDRSDRGES
jgi:SAM-dependent methyltransferase